jgi:FkbM family methyltransferase
MRAGADPIIEGRMARGHRMRLDCRVPSHCWAFFSGRYDDGKIELLVSLLRREGIALDVGANIGFYTVPLAIQAKAIGSKVIAFEPLESNAAWLRHNLALNDCVKVVHVIESALSNESGLADIVLTDDFSGGGSVGTATIMKARVIWGKICAICQKPGEDGYSGPNLVRRRAHRCRQVRRGGERDTAAECENEWEHLRKVVICLRFEERTLRRDTA